MVSKGANHAAVSRANDGCPHGLAAAAQERAHGALDIAGFGVSMKEARQGDSAVNLTTIPVTPHAIGFIKVACVDDPQFGEARTRNEFLITQRHHEDRERQPRLAAHPLQQKLRHCSARSF